MPSGFSHRTFRASGASVLPLEGAAFMQLLYKGFNQRANIRSYRFDGVVPTERPSKIVKNLEFLLRLDMTVLAEHRIRIQEAPALCLGILQSALATPGADTIPYLRRLVMRSPKPKARGASIARPSNPPRPRSGNGRDNSPCSSATSSNNNLATTLRRRGATWYSEYK